ncbi:MAG TPA: AMP-binding protein, partial [Desulfosarcina sp.]|nr:AMP-binding protein [Desulfosarcina sp.]
MTESRTIYAAFASVADRRGDHTAVIYLGTRYSYARVRRLAEAFAAALIDHGFETGQRAVIYVPNGIQWIVAWLGIQRAGGVCVPITPIYTPSDLAYIANDSGAEAIVCTDTNFGYVKRVLPETRIDLTVITKMADLLPAFKRFYGYLFDIVPRGKTILNDKTLAMGRLLRAYTGAAGSLPEPKQRGSATSEILYTGGTTKHPKGVPISHDLFMVSANEQIRVSEPLFSP